MACRGSNGSQQNSGTSATITVKTLKSKIDGNDLDLSMSGLVSVPVKELNAVKRGTHLDLSCNQLTELSEDFCSLTHLVRLDLSQNQLVSLPENFGNLINLQELDLYKNRLTTLPVSFCRLKLLKWLDLKDNPLTDDLRAATGDCLDEKQCQQAAQKVVQFMQKVQSDQERERQRKLQKQREEEHAKKLLEETNRREQQAIKKREKERRRHEHRQRDLHSNTVQKEARFAERIGKPTRVEAHNQRMVQKSSFVSKFLGCLRAIIGMLLLLLFVACCVLLVGGFILYSNCSSRPEFIPGSRPLCHDLYLWSTTGRAPNVQNVKAAFSGLNSVVADRSKALFDQIVAVDYGVWASKVRSLFTSLSDELKSKDYGGLVENSIGWAKNKTLVLSSWCQNETGPWVRRSLSTSKLQAVWVWEKIKMFTRWLLDKTLKFAERFLLTIGQIIDNMPYYWEKAKFYWNNMK